jgi:hypothetical protein
MCTPGIDALFGPGILGRVWFVAEPRGDGCSWSRCWGRAAASEGRPARTAPLRLATPEAAACPEELPAPQASQVARQVLAADRCRVGLRAIRAARREPRAPQAIRVARPARLEQLARTRCCCSGSITRRALRDATAMTEARTSAVMASNSIYSRFAHQGAYRAQQMCTLGIDGFFAPGILRRLWFVAMRRGVGCPWLPCWGRAAAACSEDRRAKPARPPRGAATPAAVA